MVNIFDERQTGFDEFAKIYRKYKIINRSTVGDYFFKEMEDLVNKLCDDFEAVVRNNRQG